MGLFGNKNPTVEMPEKALVRDSLGFWPVEIDEAFAIYRNGGYQYFGPVNMNGAVCHIFHMPEECE